MLTLEQLYNLGVNVNIDIFSGLNVPENSPINRTVLINTIMEKCGLNIPMYADPHVMASAITVWSARNQYTFEHVAKIYNADYSPIDNKNYNETTTVERSRTLNDDTDGNSTKSEAATGRTYNNLTANNSETHGGTDTTTEEHTTSAYNAATYQPDDKIVTTLGHGETITGSNTQVSDTGINSSKDTTLSTTNNKDVTENETTTTTTHQKGNIGITSNTSLQTEEYTFLDAYNPYSFLAGLFENELTLFVY